MSPQYFRKGSDTAQKMGFRVASRFWITLWARRYRWIGYCWHSSRLSTKPPNFFQPGDIHLLHREVNGQKSTGTPQNIWHNDLFSGERALETGVPKILTTMIRYSLRLKSHMLITAIISNFRSTSWEISQPRTFDRSEGTQKGFLIL